MDFIVIPAVAFMASLLTFFSGFGLGTLLTPVFAAFFPIELAIALTAIVHFLNGLFKLGLVGRYAHKQTVIQFGIPAMLTALAGAWTLGQISSLQPLATYNLAGHQFEILPVKLVVAVLIGGFTLFELVPKLRDMEIDSRYLPIGGILSGFFGGISGHQGALRSAFLSRAGLTKQQFIGTGTVISSLIDVTRIGVYSQHLTGDHLSTNSSLLGLTTVAAFMGVFSGNKLLKKVTMHEIQIIVSVCLFALAIGLGSGLI
ncbi:MAG: sulfite exporter TauE/SafE family protein [Oligoflexia bacterium]|nr:sulfite exporter TauE/SafE family protein [Oligoflexia bacterium]